MSLFDNRTDTEKELEKYHRQNNSNSSDRRKSPFDIPNGYTENNFNQQKNVNKRAGSNKGGCFLLVWLVASIIAMIVLAGISIEWVTIVLGQMFLVLGLFAMFAGKFNSIWIILFPLMGLCGIVGSLISLYGTEELREQFFNDILPMVVLGLFGIIGLGLIVVPIYAKKVKEKRCTLPVQGVVTDLNRKWVRGYKGSRGYYTYAPVYEYFHNGILYRKESNSYNTNYKKFEIGSEVTVFLNPSNPNDYYVKNLQVENIIAGVMLLVLALAGIAVYVLTGG